MTDCSADGNHVFFLVKSIIECYCRIRLFHVAKQTTLNINESDVRKKFTKLILFKHQWLNLSTEIFRSDFEKVRVFWRL